MKLTKEQIEQLYIFTHQHYVEWYDLQTELVDHLANAIEANFQSNPNLSFEEALQIEFKKFGVFGFMDVVEKRQSALHKKYNKLVWRHFSEFFQVPQILITITGFFCTYFFLKYISYAYEIYILLAGVLMLATFYYQIINIRKQNRMTKTNEKKWLFAEIIRSYGNSSLLFLFPTQLILNFGNDSSRIFSSDSGLLIATTILLAYFIFSYVMLKVIPSKADEYLNETYPEYRLEKM